METTREKSKENSHKELVKHLQDLLIKNYDAEKGFKKGMENAESTDLKQFLRQQAVKSNRFATELDKQIRELNEKPKETGSGSGSAHRTWIDIKTFFSGKEDKAILKECLRGEKASAEDYKKKMDEYQFPEQIKEMLRKQLSEIEATINRVRSLEDIADKQVL